MKITIAICTWNRSRLLRQTLESISNLEIPPDVNWEVVIVDNNSTDDTKQVIQSFSDTLPLIYWFEKTQGHSFSRNVAIARASGDLIIWTDNDVEVRPDWLCNYAAACRTYPEATFFGGGIIPVFESAMPQWLEETWGKCQAVYAARDLGTQDFRLESGQFPYGANFAIRTQTQEKFLFDIKTGRKEGDLLGGDEITLLQRVTNSGHHGVWLGNVPLSHVIPDDRATENYVARYFIGQGQSNVQNGKSMHASKWRALIAAKFHQICYRLKRRSRDADEWVSHMIRSSIASGEYLEMKRI